MFEILEVGLSKLERELELLLSPLPDEEVFHKLGISFDPNTDALAEYRDRKARQQREYRARKHANRKRVNRFS